MFHYKYTFLRNNILFAKTNKCGIHTDAIITTSEVFFSSIYATSLFIVRVRKGYSRFYGERELETEQNCNVLTPTLMTVNVVSFSFSRAAQPEAQGPSSLLDDGFLYCILSATSLDPNSSGAPRAPSGLVWLSLPHLVSNSNSNWSLSWLSPTQSLEWHVWSSSSGNNSHVVQRSLSSGASLWSGTFTLSPYYQPSSPARFPLITAIGMCHFLPAHHFEWHFWSGRRSKYNTKREREREGGLKIVWVLSIG